MSSSKVSYVASPVGVGRYVWLNNPDVKYNKDGVFKVDLALSGDIAKKFTKAVDQAVAAVFIEMTADMKAAERKKWSSYFPYQVDTEDQAITWFKFRQNATLEVEGKVKHIEIGLFDADDQRCDVPIYAGSKLRVLFKPRGILMQKDKLVVVRLDFFKVQVIELATREDMPGGFGAVEGGYVYDGSDVEEGAEDTVDGDAPKDY